MECFIKNNHVLNVPAHIVKIAVEEQKCEQGKGGAPMILKYGPGFKPEQSRELSGKNTIISTINLWIFPQKTAYFKE